jgi:hypothetical protein
MERLQAVQNRGLRLIVGHDWHKPIDKIHSDLEMIKLKASLSTSI